MNELDIISLFYEKSSIDSLDDCATLPDAPQGTQTLITTDSMAEGTHFIPEWFTPEELARRVLHVNLSDIAAGGGDPAWMLCNLGIPEKIPRFRKHSVLEAANLHDEFLTSDEFIPRFAEGLSYHAKLNGVKLIGGDTFRSTGLHISITMGGYAKRLMLRTAGEASDSLYVTGNVGRSAYGYKILSSDQNSDLINDTLKKDAVKKFLTPDARISWAQKLRETKEVHAMMDVTDGILQDAERLARASSLSIQINLDDLPLPAKNFPLPPDEAAASGEELELLFFASPDVQFDFPVTKIGQSTGRLSNKNDAVEYIKGNQKVKPAHKGFLHFT